MLCLPVLIAHDVPNIISNKNNMIEAIKEIFKPIMHQNVTMILDEHHISAPIFESLLFKISIKKAF